MSDQNPPQDDRAPKKSIEEKAHILAERIKRSGKTTRAKGHVSASTRRNQAKRDEHNS